MILTSVEKALDDAIYLSDASFTASKIIDIFVKRIQTSSNFRYWEDVNNPGHYIIKCNGQAFVLFRDQSSDNEWCWSHLSQH